MSKIESNKVISPEFMDDLKDGKLKELTNLVREDKNLLMCFRGKYINVYYKGHSMFKIEEQKKDYLICFDFNHAKFTQNWEEEWCKLGAIGYERKKNKIVSYASKIEENVFWNKSVKILKTYMDDFFNENKKFNFFDNIEPKRNKNIYLEKQRQQRIIISNQDFKNGYFIYDMEFSQANENKNVPKSGRFDMLGLKMNGQNMSIMIIELKSTISACNNKETGIIPHYEGIKKYIKEYLIEKNLIEIRKKEAEEIYKIYCELGLVSTEIKDIKVEKENVDILFILTDEAKKYKDTGDIPMIKLENDNWRL